MELEEHIAKIKRVSLGYEDHGIFTVWLHLEYGGGSAQGAGGYALDEYDETTKERVGTEFGMEFIIRLMRACGVREWSHLPGRTVFALKEKGQEWHGYVKGIRPLPTEGGVEFIFDDLASEMKSAGKV